ncbi:neuromedin-U receptor 1-like [Anticarsia gemmatalis]|uniref:neuromedin-U receptor 1-like n=1 Tax=Anticarsia gemmatalis TaxID=129554 RepID=UPI003F76A4D6
MYREPNLTSQEPDSDSEFAANVTLGEVLTEQVVLLLHLYYTPLLVLLGSLGNLLSVFIFYTSKLRLQSTSLYLSALALSDTLFLTQLLPPWFKVIQFTSLFNRLGSCQVFVYISYVTSCLSSWIVVAFTVERFVAVLYPLRRSAVCTITHAKHILSALVVGALILNVPVIKFVTPTTDDCNIDFEYYEHAERFNLVDTMVSFTVPLTVIIVLNAWIVIGVCRLERARHQLMKGEEELRSSRQAPPPCPRWQHRITRMLLIVSTVFVVLNLPAYTMRILAYANGMVGI